MCTTLCPSHPAPLAFLWIKQQPSWRALFHAQHPLACYDDSPDGGGRSRHCSLLVPSFLFRPPFFDLSRQSLLSSLSFQSSSFLAVLLLLFFLFVNCVCNQLFLLFFYLSTDLLEQPFVFLYFFCIFQRNNGFSIRKERGCCMADEDR